MPSGRAEPELVSRLTLPLEMYSSVSAHLHSLSWKGPAASLTLCMVNLLSQEGIELSSCGDHELFPAQADSELQRSHQYPGPWTCCRPLVAGGLSMGVLCRHTVLSHKCLKAGPGHPAAVPDLVATPGRTPVECFLRASCRVRDTKEPPVLHN